MAEQTEHEPQDGQQGERADTRSRALSHARATISTKRRQGAERALELLAEHEVPEAFRRARHRVVERRVHRRAQRDVGVDDDRHERDRRCAREDEAPAPPQDARLDEEDVDRDPRDEQERERVVAEREAEDDRRRDEPDAGRPAGRPESGTSWPDATRSRRRHSMSSTRMSATRKT